MPGTGAIRMRSFSPSLMPPSRPRAPSTLSDRGDRVGRGALIAQDGADGVAFLRHHDALVEGIAAGRFVGGFRQQRDVLGHDARFEAGVRIGRGLAGIGELDAGDVGRDRKILGGLLAPFGGLAHAIHDLVIGREHRDLELRQDRRKVAHHEGDFGVGFGRRRVVGRGGAAGRGFGEQALRIERRDTGREIGNA